MGLTIIRWASLTPTPWKNGGGTAVDIAGQPASGAAEQFDWRVNIATIARSGPFSDFPGIDRDFRLLDGGALELSVEGDAPRLLEPDGPAYRFPGDRPTFARLVDEAVACRAFNVLTRRGAFVSRVDEQVVSDSLVLRPEGDTVVGVVRSGEIAVESVANSARLGPFDAFVASEPVSVGSTSKGTLLLVRLIGA